MKRDWSPFVLLLVDVVGDFWSSQAEKDHPHFSENVAALLYLCRSEGIEVVHVRNRYSTDMSNWMAAWKLWGRSPGVVGTEGAESLPFARETSGEAVFYKQGYDGFLNPALREHLDQRGKRFCLTAGLLTGTCVLLTTASAAQRGYLTAVVEDCSADRPESHSATLDYYAPWMFQRVRASEVIRSHDKWADEIKRLEEAGPDDVRPWSNGQQPGRIEDPD